MYFLIADTAKSDIFIPHGKIFQVIQVAEHAYLTEFGYAREHGKLDTPVHRFKYPVKRFQRVAVFPLKILVADGL